MRFRGRFAIGATVAAILFGLAMPAVARPSGASLEGVPRFRHVVVLVEENENAAETFGSTSPARYLNGLVAQGAFVPNYYGTGHVSLDNYVAMASGEPNNGVTNTDCSTVSLYTCAQSTLVVGKGRNLGDQLDEADLSWKSYMDGTTTPCFHGSYSSSAPDVVTPDPYQGDGGQGTDYADRHNPFIYFPDFVGNQDRCVAHQRPIADLASDLASGTLPAFSFITPDTCDDGHDAPCHDGRPGGLTTADSWLSNNVPALLTYLSTNRGLLVINFDEASPTNPSPVPTDLTCGSCVSAGIGGRTGALVLGPKVAAGAVVTTGYDHYSLLRTVEDALGIAEHLNLAGRAAAMRDVFAEHP